LISDLPCRFYGGSYQDVTTVKEKVPEIPIVADDMVLYPYQVGVGALEAWSPIGFCHQIESIIFPSSPLLFPYDSYILQDYSVLMGSSLVFNS